MLLSALSAPEVEQAYHETSAYLNRAPASAGTFIWGVAIISIIVFIAAVVPSMRVPSEPPK